MKEFPAVMKDDKNKISSKRVITLMLAITLIVIVLANTFFDCKVDTEIYAGLVDVLIWSLGFIGSEQFAGAIKNRYSRPTNPEAQLPPRPGGEEREEF